MRRNSTIAILLLSITLNVCCQVTGRVHSTGAQPDKKAENDSFPAIEYKCSDKNAPRYYINGINVHPQSLNVLNPKLIDSINVEKRTNINEKKDNGHIYIKLKKEYNPRFISLVELKQKHSKYPDTSTIFLIDNELINDNYADYIIDEKYILKIIITTIEDKHNRSIIEVFRLLTRSEYNIKQSKEIRIRGGNIPN